MCRFLLLSSQEPCDVRQVVEQFARMCEQSTCLDGDWQGDGWGMAWWQENTGWHVHRSLAPVWTEADCARQVPGTRRLVVHARAASFPQHKGDLAFAQPYVDGPYAFVFNGLIEGVRLPRGMKIPGAIGAEKIWYLVRQRLAQGLTLQDALASGYAFLERRSRRIQACNMGLSDSRRAVSHNGNPTGHGYYQLFQAQREGVHLICSEPFGAWPWRA
jgi:predicted glutamine amidotransferase